jgi:hypothetical protein
VFCLAASLAAGAVRCDEAELVVAKRRVWARHHASQPDMAEWFWLLTDELICIHIGGGE